MFQNPAKTGLILIGASEFTHRPDEYNRVAFLNAKNAIKNYFKSPKNGFSIREKNILDIFDSDDSVNHQINTIESFLNNKSIEDIFIYVCSHGWRQVNSNILRILTKNSRENNESSSINFEELIYKIDDISGSRVFYLIDCCVSGVVHNESHDIVIPVAAAAYITNIDVAVLPRRGAAILTSNGRDCIGGVIASDDLEGIDKPIFSHFLIETLTKGDGAIQGPGMSMLDLKNSVRSRIADFMNTLREQQTQDPDADFDEDLYNNYLLTNLADVSDRVILDGVNSNQLSKIQIFQNNINRNELISRLARRTRISYDREQRQFEEIESLKTKNSALRAVYADLKIQKEALEAKVISLRSGFWAAVIVAIVSVVVFTTQM